MVNCTRINNDADVDKDGSRSWERCQHESCDVPVTFKLVIVPAEFSCLCFYWRAPGYHISPTKHSGESFLRIRLKETKYYGTTKLNASAPLRFFSRCQTFTNITMVTGDCACVVVLAYSRDKSFPTWRPPWHGRVRYLFVIYSRYTSYI